MLYLHVNLRDSRCDRMIMLTLDRRCLHSAPHNIQWVAACLTDHSSDGTANEWGRESRNSHRVHCSSTRSHHRTWSTQHFEIRRRSGLSRVAIKISTVPISGETGCPRRAPSVPCFTIIYNSHSHSYNPRLFFFSHVCMRVCICDEYKHRHRQRASTEFICVNKSTHQSVSISTCRKWRSCTRHTGLRRGG